MQHIFINYSTFRVVVIVVVVVVVDLYVDHNASGFSIVLNITSVVTERLPYRYTTEIVHFAYQTVLYTP